MQASLNKKAVFLYDYTGLMAKPWIGAGYECWCFDGQHEPGVKRDGLHVKVGMWFYPQGLEYQAAIIRDLVGSGAVMVFGFPECTDLTNAGTKHWGRKRNENPDFQANAMALCDLVRMVGEVYNCPWAFENPIGALSTIYRKPDFLFHPCDYAGYLAEDDEHPVYPDVYPGRDLYNKNTCIWSGNGFVEPAKKRIEPLHKDNPGWRKCGGKSVRTKKHPQRNAQGFCCSSIRGKQTMSKLNQILANELVRTLAMGACIVNVFLAAFLCAKIGTIEAKIDAIGESVVICRWKHDKHYTVAIKGGKMADKMIRAFGPSEGGECK